MRSFDKLSSEYLAVFNLAVKKLPRIDIFLHVRYLTSPFVVYELYYSPFGFYAFREQSWFSNTNYDVIKVSFKIVKIGNGYFWKEDL